MPDPDKSLEELEAELDAAHDAVKTAYDVYVAAKAAYYDALKAQKNSDDCPRQDPRTTQG